MLNGCYSPHPRIPTALEVSFRNLVPIADMNNYFQISVDSNNSQFGQDITIVIRNLSDHDIYFPVENVIKMFIINSNKWIEVKDKDISYGDELWLRPKSEQMPEGRLVTWVRPILPSDLLNVGNQVILRIVIIGEMSLNDTENVSVGAFTDVFISP